MPREDAVDPIVSQYGRMTPADIIRSKSESIKGRLIVLENTFFTCMAQVSNAFHGLYLNRHLLRAAVESYYCDIYRLKFFRPVEWADNHKKAAYMMKWIARTRPLQLHIRPDVTPALLKANAFFAVMSGMNLLEVKPGWRDDEWWHAYIRNLIYLLHFHSPSAEQLSSEMFVVETLKVLSKNTPHKTGDRSGEAARTAG